MLAFLKLGDALGALVRDIGLEGLGLSAYGLARTCRAATALLPIAGIS